MESFDEYFAYGGETEASLPELWGVYAWAPFTFNLPEKDPIMDKIYDSTTLSAIHFDIAMHFQKKKCTTFGAWDKTALWNAQMPYADALKEYWDNGMMEHLSEIRRVKESICKKLGIPVTRNRAFRENKK
jgi:hypothetical protein